MAAAQLRIGTRGSPLALWQAHCLRDLLCKAHGMAEDAIAITVIKTSGDRIQDRPLSEVGGKGLFTKEIEDALLDGSVDLAVHSMKDVATVLPAGLTILCLLPREDPRDAFLSHKAKTLLELPPGSLVGTSSLRRQAQVLRARPDLRVATLRGNVETRLRKLDAGEVDATLLALAGLNRLKLSSKATSVVPVSVMLPAIAQGAIGIEARIDDLRVAGLLQPLNDPPTAICVAVERAFLGRLDGSCRTPIAGLARLEGDGLVFHGMILSVDGRKTHEVMRTGKAPQAAEIGQAAAEEVLRAAGPDFLSRA